MRIDLIIDSLNGGGAEKICINLANYFSKKNYRTRILVIKSKKSPYLELISEKVKIESFNKKNITYAIFDLLKYVYSNEKTIILSFSPAISCLLNVFKLILFKKNKVYSRCINTLSERKKYQKQSWKQKILSILIKFFYARSEKIIAQSEGMKEDLINNIGIKADKIIIINNPCDIEKIKKLSLEKISTEEEKIFLKKTIINVASLTPKKNQIFLIKLLKKLKERGLEFNLLLLGEGPQKKELIELGKELLLEENIYFLGFQKNPYKYLKKSNFFFLSSFVEGFPNVLLDALACDKVVFSTNCKSGPEEILEGRAEKNKVLKGKYGYLISIENLVDLNDEFLDELENCFHKKFMNEENKEVLKKYNPKDIFEKYEEVILGDKKMIKEGDEAN